LNRQTGGGVADSKNVVSDKVTTLSPGHVIRRMCVAKFAIIKGALQYLSRYSSDFDEILYADANFDFEDGNVTEDQNYTIREGGQTPC